MFGINVSRGTVNLERKNLGWTSKSTQYCQNVRHVNKAKRMEYALLSIHNQENFHNVIFTDESTVKINVHSKRSMYKIGEPKQLKGVPKHPVSVHVWAGISRRGATQIHIFTGRMDSLYYQHILEERLVPFIRAKFPDGHRFMQDNDPKHVSKSTVKFMRENGINHWPTPPESPDMNPIECRKKYFIHIKQNMLMSDIYKTYRTYDNTYMYIPIK